jgi:hypothetical protein
MDLVGMLVVNHVLTVRGMVHKLVQIVKEMVQEIVMPVMEMEQ